MGRVSALAARQRCERLRGRSHAEPGRSGRQGAWTLALTLLVGCGDFAPTRGPAEEAVALPAHDAPLDSALAARGLQDFRNRGCVACHKVGGGKLVGPDLLGVTRRRTYSWYRLMVLRPDSMLVSDSTAMALLREYATPMTDQRASEAEVRTIWEYLRDADAPPPEGSS